VDPKELKDNEIMQQKDNNENIQNVSQTRNVTILDEEHKNKLEEHVIQ
jgi:hypothetical protein